jgi:DNA topoisomerase VI subunit A
MREAFIEKNFRKRSLALIYIANDIIAEYQEQGYDLTLRQLYYQFVARDYIENSQRSYKNLGSVINDARLAGYIDWSAIEDRTRNLESQWHFQSPKDAIEQMRRQYVIDMWENQDTRVEVWIEKEALVGVIAKVCRDNDVPFLACRGFVSQSEMYAAGKRIEHRYHEHGQHTVIIHLGDHDPSGIDMTRDNDERLYMFSGLACPEVKRIALNMNQVETYKPPPNPAKLTDSRARDYIARYGKESWELDALDPKVITRLIEERVDQYRDIERWNEKVEQHEEECETLDVIIEDLS